MSELRFQLVPVPVADVDRSISFYAGQVGFALDHDVRPAPGLRVAQLTPPGSACSILLSTGLGEISAMTPGALRGLHLVVDSIAAARDALLARGVEVGQIDDVGGGVRMARFADPDGNSWLLQEIPANLVPPS